MESTDIGRVDPGAVSAALRDDTVLVTLMLANNEVGTLQPVSEVAALCRDRGVAIHTDAAQAVGKVPVNVADLGVDLLSVAGHKLYAPKGVGALYVREGVEILPQIRGAGHERGRRAGTENVLLAVGLGTACELARNEVREEQARLADLRERLADGLRTGCEDLVEHGHPEHRLPNTLSVALPGHDANGLVERIGRRAGRIGRFGMSFRCNHDFVRTAGDGRRAGVGPRHHQALGRSVHDRGGDRQGGRARFSRR